MTQAPILISGAGLSSLLLGRSLFNSKIPFRIYERDESLSFRGQGYRLRLSNEGLDSIESVIGKEEFERFYNEFCGKTGGGGIIEYDALTGEIQTSIEEQLHIKQKQKEQREKDEADEHKDDDDKGKKDLSVLASRNNLIIGISRGDLRNLLYEPIKEYVEFSKGVIGYELEEEEEGGIKVIFQDGSKSIKGSMLIGGDGIKSKISKQLSNNKLKTYDTKSIGIHGQAPTKAFKQLGEGVFKIVENQSHENQDAKFKGTSIITNVRSKDMDNPNINFGWTMVTSPDDVAIIGKEASRIAKQLTSKWNSKFKPLFDEMIVDDAAFWKITCSTPSGIPEWLNQPRITLIGDSVHSMTPAGGLGANTALRDSALLGKLLEESNGYRNGLTKEYEEKMKVYANEAVNQSYSTAVKQFGIHIDEENSPVV
ncbi:uncharacterized protein L201_001797 [Kwoniella dendrophila CBS 6074]|uniref:FAD-binding domain-containing protein n=1 Tax=Kwoniella dendrophila CBS 6074 TaxID=1295534 RepID=A0AAX4JPW8_9TREE